MEQEEIQLSNKILKAYIKKGNKKIAFHLSSHLMIPTNEYFDSIKLEHLGGNFTLSNGEKINLGKTSWVVSDTDYDYTFNGKMKVIQIHLMEVILFKLIQSEVIDIEIMCQFRFRNRLGRTEMPIKTTGLLRKMYDERRFNREN